MTPAEHQRSTPLIIPYCGLSFADAERRVGDLVWGEPIPMGPTKFHLYGALRATWEPLNVEVWARGEQCQITALAPGGGDTLLKFLAALALPSPVRAFLGSHPVEEGQA